MADNMWSYVHEPISRPIQYKTLCDHIEELLEKDGCRLAAIHCYLDGSTEQITLADLCKKAKILAQYMVQCGLQHLDKVAIMGPNCIQWIIGDLGIIYAGGTAVHMAMTMTDGSDIVELIEKTEIKAFLLGDLGTSHTAMIANIARNKGVKVVLLQRLTGEDNLPFLPEIVEKYFQDASLPLLYPEDGVFVFTTSGSTGRPKLVQHNHLSIFTMASHLFDDGKQIFYNDRPFGWVAGCPLLHLCMGFTRVFMRSDIAMSGLNTLKIWKCIKDTNCTMAMVMPYFINDILENMNSITNLNYKVDLLLSGGQIVENYEKLIGIVCNKFLIGYGQTEFVMVSTILVENNTHSLEKGDIGKPAPGVEVRIVGSDGQTTFRNCLGSIELRGPSRCIGYLGSKALSDELFTPEGWVKSGDIGKINDEGHLVIHGRMKDVISRGTRKIIPGHIESIISHFSGIRDVVVVGVPHKRLGEDICVCFTTNDGSSVSANEVEDMCKAIFLQQEAVDGLGEKPTYFLKFDKIPQIQAGKVDKITVKKLAKQLLDL